MSKLLLSCSKPLSGDKAAALLAKVAEFTGMDAEDILLLPEGVTVVHCPCPDLPASGKKAPAGEKKKEH